MPPSWGYCWWTRTWSVSVAVGGWVQSSFLTFTQHFLSFYYFNSFIVVNSSNRNKNYHNSSWISMWIWPYIVRSSSSIISIAIAIVIAIGINQSVLRYEYYYYYCCCCCCCCTPRSTSISIRNTICLVLRASCLMLYGYWYGCEYGFWYGSQQNNNDNDNDNDVATTTSTTVAINHRGSSVKMGVLWNESSSLLLLLSSSATQAQQYYHVSSSISWCVFSRTVSRFLLYCNDNCSNDDYSNHYHNSNSNCITIIAWGTITRK